MFATVPRPTMGKGELSSIQAREVKPMIAALMLVKSDDATAENLFVPIGGGKEQR